MTPGTNPESPAPNQDIARPRLTWRKVILAWLAIILLGWVGFELYWRVTAEPAPIIDYASRINDHASSFQPDGENGWDALVEIMAEIGVIESEAVALEVDVGDDGSGAKVSIDFDRLQFDPPDTDAAPREMFMLRRFDEDEIFVRMQAALEHPRVLRPLPPGSIVVQIPLPNLGEFRSFARARAASMRLAMERVDPDELIRGHDQILALASMCAHQPFLIDRLVGMAIAVQAHRDLAAMLVDSSLDVPTCQALLANIDRRSTWPAWELQMEVERLSSLDLIQHAFSDDGHGGGRPDLKKLANLTGYGMDEFEGLSSYFLAGRRETADVVNEVYDMLIRESRLTAVERASSPDDPDAFVQDLPRRLAVVRLIAPDLGRTLSNGAGSRVYERGTRLMLHLEIHRHRHGEYPETLDALVDAIDPETLVDPTSGKRFIYRRMDPDAHGRTYVLYAIGADGRDDHADQPLTDLEAAFPRTNSRREGTDILINRRRPTREEAGY